ncbi:MAG: hypothetical protein R3Y52_03490, partial [Psittacicella sp.]
THEDRTKPNAYLSTLYCSFHDEINTLSNIHIKKIFMGYSTHAYLINLAGARSMLEFNYPVKFHADCWIQGILRNYINTYAIVDIPLILQKSTLDIIETTTQLHSSPSIEELINSNFTSTSTNLSYQDILAKRANILSQDDFFDENHKVSFYEYDPNKLLKGPIQIENNPNIYTWDNYKEYANRIINYYSQVNFG